MTGARSRRAERIASALPIVASLRGHEAEVDRVWWSRHDSSEDRSLWLVTPVSHGTREEDALADSNYDTAERLLAEASSFGDTDTRYDLWPGGRIETILVRADDAGALRCLQGIVSALADYPVLDDTHYSELQWERDHPSDHECYAEDCSCPVAEHEAAMRKLGQRGAHPFGVPDSDGEVWCGTCGTWVEGGYPVIYLGDDMTEQELADTAVAETRGATPS